MFVDDGDVGWASWAIRDYDYDNPQIGIGKRIIQSAKTPGLG